MKRSLFVVALLAAGISLLAATKKATPPKSEDLFGIWTGLDEDELVFTRLDLRADHTGYCARVSPADTVLHEYGVHVYKITRWAVDGWKLTFATEPLDSAAERIFLRGGAGAFTLQLEVGGMNGQWKRHLVLRRESRIQTANQETKAKIEEAEKR